MTDTQSTAADSGLRNPRFLIIGAGMSGILTAIKLLEAGLDDFTIYEKGDRVGGTWRENTYPGIACDVPSHFYSYSFAPNPDWSQRFSPGAEIQAYFDGVSRRYAVDSRIRFGTEITRCAFESGRWTITAADGSTDVGDFVIAATGVLHHPAYPDLEGQDRFEGVAFHSARWNHDVPLDGRHVGIIGTGSSAIQIVSAIVGQVARLSLFQRTPQWIAPIENAAYSEAEKSEFRRNPAAMAAIREEISRGITDGFANVLIDANSPVLDAIQNACTENLENKVTDPVLREKLRPNYRAACKRLVMSEDFYEAIQKPHAEVITETIDGLEKSGVRTRDGRLHELDVLIYATGFRVDRFMRPMEVIGREGTSLEDAWTKGPSAYLAISIPDFPNFFMLNGPNGPVGNFSLIEVAELQFAYILQLVEAVRSGSCRELSASRSALQRFDAERIEAAKHTIWSSGCRSWYLDANGVPAAWPFTFDRFREEMARPDFEDYEMR